MLESFRWAPSCKLMKYSLTVNISDKTIVIVSADGSVRSTFPNLAGLDENDNFLYIGKTPDEIRVQAPQEWDKVKDKIHFENLFSVDYFRPELAASTIELLVYMTTHPTPKSRWSLIKDSVELFLQIPGYERLSASTQELFEFRLQETCLTKVKALSISNQAKSLSNVHRAKKFAEIGLPASTILVFLLVFSLLSALLGEHYFVIPKDEKWWFLLVFIIFFMIFMGFVIYFGMFIFVVWWKFATRNLVPDTISKKIMEINKIVLPKPLMSLIWQKLPSKIDDG